MNEIGGGMQKKTTQFSSSPFPDLFSRLRKRRRKNETRRRGRVERATDAKNLQGEGPRRPIVGREERGRQESCEYPIIGGYCGIITPLAADSSKS